MLKKFSDSVFSKVNFYCFSFKWSSELMTLYNTVVGIYINTMRTIFIFKFCFLTYFFQITRLQSSLKESANSPFLFISFFMCTLSALGRNKKLRYKVVLSKWKNVLFQDLNSSFSKLPPISKGKKIVDGKAQAFIVWKQ